MPTLYYLIDEVLRRLRRTQGNMSDLVVQVLIRKRLHIRHNCGTSSSKIIRNQQQRNIQLPKPDESLRQACGTQVQVLALLNLTELQRCKPILKERRIGPFVPFIYIDKQQGPRYSQPSGNYHSKG